MESWLIFKDWFLSFGGRYNVNPYIFGAIYLGAIPFFFFFLKQTILKIKQRKAFLAPLIFTGLSFISAYLYLIIAGKNIPLWVYVFIGIMVVYSVYSTVNKIKSKTKADKL